MYTYSYSWKVWKSPKLLASGQDIFAYLKEAAEEQGIMDNIRFNAKVEKAELFSSKGLKRQVKCSSIQSHFLTRAYLIDSVPYRRIENRNRTIDGLK